MITPLTGISFDDEQTRPRATDTSPEASGQARRQISEDGVDYPPSPWRLMGPFFVAGSLTPIERAREHIPRDLRIVSVAKGRTLSAIGLIHYCEDSVFHYNELVVIAGLVRIGRRVGGWISHIYVDSTRSQAGGIELFGLPKQLAGFSVDRGESQTRYTIEADDGLALQVEFANARPIIPIAGAGSCFGSVGGDRRVSKFRIRGSVRSTTANIDIAATTPFASLEPHRPSRCMSGHVSIAAATHIQVLRGGPHQLPDVGQHSTADT
jgi:acetoacetate decarboxylase